MQERCVALHLEQVVLLLPHEGDALELTQRVALGLLLCEWASEPGLVTLCQHKVEDELLPPQDDALDHVEREHAETVEDVDALLEQRHVRLAVS